METCQRHPLSVAFHLTSLHLWQTAPGGHLRSGTSRSRTSELSESSEEVDFSVLDHLFYSEKTKTRRHRAHLDGVVDEILAMLTFDHPALMRLREHFVGAQQLLLLPRRW